MFTTRVLYRIPLFFALFALFCISKAFGGGTTLAQVEIYDRVEGRILPIYHHNGRNYVVGHPGHEYAILLRGVDIGRALAVVSVDGVNVITGDTASPEQDGYVLTGRQLTEIDGWRKSLSQTAAFYFTTVEDSYAGKTKRPDNVGVIGVALFRERLWDTENVPNSADSRRDRPAAAPPAPSAQRGELGTGHGKSESSWASYTSFRRASDTAAEIVTIYYDSYHNLVTNAIIPASPADQQNSPDPNPFPARFVPDPS